MSELDYMSFHVLVVDDEEDNLDAFRFAFRKSFNLHYALGGTEALEILDRVDVAVIVSDQRMPQMSGIEFLRRAKERRPDVVGILLTAYADLPVLIDAINSGAVDRYLQKPWDSKELTIIMRQAIKSFETVRENKRLRDQLAHYAGYLEREQRDPFDYGEISVPSGAMREVRERIDEVADSNTHVLIQAEPGCEQEVVARALHVGGSREHRPFIRVTCSAFGGEALERELFGWRKGAFEAAFDDRAGRFELADGGTIYLDAPDTPTPTMQARLVQLLEQGSVERVGSTHAHQVDVRVIISVAGALEDAWHGEHVLERLTSRLTVFPIRIPPLRERREDILPLAEHFIKKYARRNKRAATRISTDAIGVLEAYDFPGNTRELENVVERASILARGDEIGVEHLAFSPRRQVKERSTESAKPVTAEPPPPPQTKLGSRLEDIERRELLSALERCAGNKAEVARTLGIQRTTLYYRLKKLGIDA